MKPIRLIVCSGLLVVLACSSVQAATFIVPGDFGTIQGAIADAGTVNGDEIVVQPGTYPEAINFLGKAITLRSASGDPNNTIIDGTGFFHVVQCVSGEDPNTVLYGFTIRRGEAAGVSSPDDVGGGMYNFKSSPTVTNCIFTDNHAKISGGGLKGEGGGMYNDQSHPIVTDCTFELNSAEKSGGGMYNNKSNSIVTDCTFSFNSAGLSGMGFGGGLYNFKSSSTVTNCVFIGNSGANGGGMANGVSNSVSTDCTFSSNTATYDGGGMHNSGGNPMVTGCTFSDNLADGDGGGMFTFNSRTKVFYCKFISNKAINGGGMRNRLLSNPNVNNCIFSRNLALDGNGAGMSNTGTCSPAVVNCTFSDNKITDNPAGGGGMSNELSSSPTVTNTIFWGNLPEQVSYDPTSIRHITFSLVQGGSTGIGNIDDDPNFVDAFSDDLHLQAGSPAIDAGTNAVTGGPWDLDGNNRFIDDPNTEDTGRGPGEIVDMGAYEFGASQCLCDNGLVGDINCDGVVDRLDVRLLEVHWLEKI
jgi:hypothetical protein